MNYLFMFYFILQTIVFLSVVIQKENNPAITQF